MRTGEIVVAQGRPAVVTGFTRDGEYAHVTYLDVHGPPRKLKALKT